MEVMGESELGRDKPVLAKRKPTASFRIAPRNSSLIGNRISLYKGTSQARCRLSAAVLL